MQPTGIKPSTYESVNQLWHATVHKLGVAGDQLSEVSTADVQGPGLMSSHECQWQVPREVVPCLLDAAPAVL